MRVSQQDNLWKHGKDDGKRKEGWGTVTRHNRGKITLPKVQHPEFYGHVMPNKDGY